MSKALLSTIGLDANLTKSVPFIARGAFANPFCRLLTTVFTYVCNLIFRHTGCKVTKKITKTKTKTKKNPAILLLQDSFVEFLYYFFFAGAFFVAVFFAAGFFAAGFFAAGFFAAGFFAAGFFAAGFFASAATFFFNTTAERAGI